ncbi:MAG: Hit-like protein involved in cell-cycle regulation [Parcubacteria group bacterium Gr01-1014_66]|nr:MAG: Hit-like protein involved in cell-cycle regulation [Parcubacteria group bacterium Gr01-1014_66]
MACIFCDIIAGKQNACIVYEDAFVKGFYDIHPKAPVHVLVVPKVHIESVAHLKGDEDKIVTGLIYAAKKVAEEEGLRGYKLMINVGADAGQVVPHLHLHLLGGPQDSLAKVSVV